MVPVRSLRASDADREQVAERLRIATTEGRLTAGEFEDRLGALYRSRTYGELDALTADLPSTAPARRRAGLPMWVVPAAVLALLAAIGGLLAGLGRHAVVAAAPDQTPHRVIVGGPLGDPHHAFVAAASVVALL